MGLSKRVLLAVLGAALVGLPQTTSLRTGAAFPDTDATGVSKLLTTQASPS